MSSHSEDNGTIQRECIASDHTSQPWRFRSQCESGVLCVDWPVQCVKQARSQGVGKETVRFPPLTMHPYINTDT